MQKRIFVYFIVLIIIGGLITGVFSSLLIHNIYQKDIEDRMTNSISLISYQTSKVLQESYVIDYDELAMHYSSLLKFDPNTPDTDSVYARVTLVDFHGNLLGESDKKPKNSGNYLEYKEIKTAIQGDIGQDIRLNKLENIKYLFIAMPVPSSQVIISLSFPLVFSPKINDSIFFYTVLGIIAALIITSLLALKFSSDITEPINELSVVSREIASGNYKKRSKINSKDELGQLSSNFNEMASKLEVTVADLTDRNNKFDIIVNSLTNGIIAVNSKKNIILLNKIAFDIFGIEENGKIIGSKFIEFVRNYSINMLVEDTFRTRSSKSSEITISFPERKILSINTSIVKSAEDAAAISGVVISVTDITKIKKLEEIRTSFVSNVTHELKTPLTSIRGFIETLRGGAIKNSEVAERFLEIIDIEAERLYMLIDDILQLSEIESRKDDYSVQNNNVHEIIKEIVDILSVSAEKKGVKISYECDPKLTVLANKNRIKQILLNLTDNAIKYNKENGSVHIKAYRPEGKIVITVKDTGIGIEPSHVDRIFERFYRVDKGRSRNMGGTGLGLSIVKHIVNLYNGDVNLVSTPGQGTEFIVQLPN